MFFFSFFLLFLFFSSFFNIQCYTTFTVRLELLWLLGRLRRDILATTVLFQPSPSSRQDGFFPRLLTAKMRPLTNDGEQSPHAALICNFFPFFSLFKRQKHTLILVALTLLALYCTALHLSDVGCFVLFDGVRSRFTRFASFSSKNEDHGGAWTLDTCCHWDFVKSPQASILLSIASRSRNSILYISPLKNRLKRALSQGMCLQFARFHMLTHTHSHSHTQTRDKRTHLVRQMENVPSSRQHLSEHSPSSPPRRGTFGSSFSGKKNKRQ